MQIEEINHEHEKFFIKSILFPYLSSVYYGLIKRGNKDYIGVQRLKEYLNLPPLLGTRVTNLINANGDERIDHDEFVIFFMRVLVGSI